MAKVDDNLGQSLYSQDFFFGCLHEENEYEFYSLKIEDFRINIFLV